MALTSKSLAQINKSLDEGRATKKHSALRDASRAERAEFYFDLLCQLARSSMAGAFLRSCGSDEQIFGVNEQNPPRDQSDRVVAPPYDVGCPHNAERADPGQPRIPVWPGSLPWLQ